MVFDVARVRGLYTSLSDGWTYVNAMTTAQVPEKVSASVSRSFRRAPLATVDSSGSHRLSQSMSSGEEFLWQARVALAQLFGVEPECILFGPSRTVLLNQLAHAALNRTGLGDEIILGRGDDPASVVPWQQVARMQGATIRWAEPDLSTGVIPTWQFLDLVSESTRVVALAAAHPQVGTVTDIKNISFHVRSQAKDAWIVIDADAMMPYRQVSMEEWDADAVVFDLAPLGGPSLGVLVLSSEEMLDELYVFDSTKGRRVIPHGDDARTRQVAEVEWTGAVPGLLGAVPALVEHWLGLDEVETADMDRTISRVMGQVSGHTSMLGRRLVEGLQTLDGVHVVGLDGEFDREFSYDSVDRVARVSFLIPDVSALRVKNRLAANGVLVDIVYGWQAPLLDLMGATEHGGVVCVSLSLYNTVYDVDEILRVVAGLV